MTYLPTPRTSGDLGRLHRQLVRTGDGRLRETLILRHQWLVRSIAVRFTGFGEELDDLVQVGNIGLINALDRYDPDLGPRFSTYATPAILGEIKRHFRDKTGTIKIPRGMREMRDAAERAATVMTGELGRAPTIVEVAARLGATDQATLAALAADPARMPASLDAPLDTNRSEDALTLLDRMGCREAAMETFAAHEDVRTAVALLGAREREVIRLRFFEEMSQARIARRMNLSQMHVSRLQRKALGRLREVLAD